MKVKPGLPLHQGLRTSAQRLLALSVEALKPRRGLILVEHIEGWTEAAGFGLPEEFWQPDMVAVEAIRAVASDWTPQIFADTGAPTDSPLSFLQGNLSSVIVFPWVLQENKALLYLARPFADGLYQEEHIEQISKVLSSLL